MTENVSDRAAYFSSYCHDELFNSTKFFMQSVPIFSDCLQHTFFTWTPVIGCFLSLPVLVRAMATSRAIALNCTTFFVTKIIAVLICLFACKFKGIITSGVLFLSFVAFALFSVPEFIAKIDYCIKSHEFNSFTISSICFFAYFSLMVMQIFLHSFAEKPADHELVETGQTKPSPEGRSSFLNRILFWWFTSICLTGWRRPLTVADLYDLNSEDRSDHLTKNWEARWRPRIQNFMRAKRQAAVDPAAVTRDCKSAAANFDSNQENVKFVKRPPTPSNGEEGDDVIGQRRPENTQRSSTAKYPPEPSIIWCLVLTFKNLIIPATILKTLADSIQFINPILLNALITFVQAKNEPMWLGYFYTFAMFCTSTVYTLLLHQYFDYILRFGMNLRTVLSASVFDKVLKLSNSAQKSRGVGETVNIMSTDIQRFQDTAFFINMAVSNPYQIAVAVYFLWQQVGASVLAGVAVMILLIPLNYLISTKQRKYQVQQMRLKDERIKLMSEILNGMKVIKLYAWEESFEVQILKLRQKELVLMRKNNYFMAVATFLWTCAPVFVSVATFAVYVLTTDEGLTAQKAFVSLALFNILRFPMSMLPLMTTAFVQANVSNKRLKSFLCADEIDLSTVDRTPNVPEAVKITKGSFSWDKENETEKSFTLSDINFVIPTGHLVAIVGKVGSGKSSLLSAILGEMEKVSGSVSVKGKLAYVPQQAWIQNMTLKSNVLFGGTLNQRAYEKTLQACSLDVDIKALPAGDMTEIGEKGINLSGGQKQRVSLARAVYRDADVYLFDDPLSAVDAHVGKHIFEKVLSNQGILQNKTRILVTHSLNYLKDVQNIFVLTDGRISERGTYQQLLAKRGAFAAILVHYLQESYEKQETAEEVELQNEIDSAAEQEILQDIKDVQPILLTQLSTLSSGSSQKNFDGSNGRKKSQSLSRSSGHKSAGEKSKKQTTGLISEEIAETGRVKRDVYTTYFAAMGYASLCSCVFLIGIANAFGAAANFWLSNWSEAMSGLNLNGSLGNSSHTPLYSNDYYLGVYVSMGILQGAFILFSAILLSVATVAASKILHVNLIQHLFRAPLNFFDVTPFGRILNRCGKDIDVIDSALANTIRSWIHCACSVVTTVAVICTAIHLFGLVITPLAVMYYFVLFREVAFGRSQRATLLPVEVSKRWNARPLFRTFFAQIVRFFVKRFYVSTSRQLKRLESVTRSPIFSHFQESIAGVTSIRAYGAQRPFIGRSFHLMDANQACYYATLISNRWLAVRLEFIGNLMGLFAALFSVLGRDHFSGGQVGLAVSYALSVTQVLNWAVRMTSDLETNIVSVERVKEYSEIQLEAPWTSGVRPPADWPSKGAFVFDDLCLKYRADLEPVLDHLHLRIDGGQKIGIVGRTGAGKSSLTLALFRIVEASRGRISLDGVDVATLGLHDLRSRLTIIPQDPILFSSEFRFNLDPFDKHTDEEIWAALEQAHLKIFIANQPEKLLFKILEGGENLSVGQRQLVCLARALLRKTKVLILDEATAAVDLETDELVQKSIRQYFADCTILTIAHRLNTILDSDKILVLSNGRVVEFDSPEILLQNDKSLFYALAKDAGVV